MAGERANATIGAIGSAVAIIAVAIFAYLSTTTAKRDREDFTSRLDATDARLEQNSKALVAVKQATPADNKQDIAAIAAKVTAHDETLAALQKSSSSVATKQDLAAIDARIKTLGDTMANLPKAPSTSDIGALAAKVAATDKALADLRAAPAGGQALAESHVTAIASLGKAVDDLKGTMAAQAKALEAVTATLAGLNTALDGVKADAARAVAASESAVRGTAEPQKNLVVVHVPGEKAPAADAPLSVQFDKIGATHPAVSAATLVGDLKKMVKDRRDCIVSVAGYADTLGTDSVNLQVSKARAEAVASQLRSGFADDKNVQVKEVAWGERQLKVWTRDGKSEKANRRVDIHVECKS